MATSWKVLMQHTKVTSSHLPTCVIVSFEPMPNFSNLVLKVCLFQFKIFGHRSFILVIALHMSIIFLFHIGGLSHMTRQYGII